ncbi:MAG: hypothetical protein V7603_602 [Micromonosporaceae bacterium]
MRALLVALVAAACVTACRGPSTRAGGAPPSGTAAKSVQDFARCMREHGQNVPDPDPNSGNLTLTQPPGAPAGWTAARQACQHFLPNNGAPAVPDPGELEALRRYAVCMRGHGIEMTDPDPGTGRSQFQGRLARANRDQIANDPAYRAAEVACRDRLPGADSPKGAGR